LMLAKEEVRIKLNIQKFESIQLGKSLELALDETA
jgi:hypothetical protein